MKSLHPNHVHYICLINSLGVQSLCTTSVRDTLFASCMIEPRRVARRLVCLVYARLELYMFIRRLEPDNRFAHLNPVKTFDLLFEQTLDESVLLDHCQPPEGFAGHLEVIKFTASSF